MKFKIFTLIIFTFVFTHVTHAQKKNKSKKKSNGEQKEEGDITKSKLYDFLNLLTEEKDPYIKDSLLNIYFNSKEYTDKRFKKQLADHVELLKLKFLVDTLDTKNKETKSQLKIYQDSLNLINSKFITARGKYISKSDRLLQRKTLIGSDVGFSPALGMVVQVSILKNISPNKVSYWGVNIGIQKNYENIPPMIVGIKNLTKFSYGNFFNSFSVWLSGIRENKLATHINSKIGRVFRANTYGGSYGIGLLLGSSQKSSFNQIITFGINAQKYTILNKENVSTDLQTYSTEFAFGAFTSLTLLF